MLAALLTTVFFATTAPIARRSAQLLGPTSANLARLCLATAILAIWVGLAGHGAGAALPWFLASGVAGFGLGGVLMFQALPRAGSNLANLVVQCGSAVVALGLEHVWLGTAIHARQAACIALILGGVIVALAPRSFPQLPASAVRLGAVLALLSAAGQGCGAVLSRKAFAVARAAGTPLDPATATLQRLLGGLAIATLAWMISRAWVRDRPASATPGTAAWPWVAMNTLTGPVLGVTCMQWALSTTPAGIVQPIVAMAPLFTAPVALGLGEALPRERYFLGTTVAFVATVILWRLS